MFKSFFCKKDKKSSQNNQNNELKQKILKMNLTEKKAYVENKISSMPMSQDGVVTILNSLINQDSNTKQRYLKSDDNDTKVKKALDLIISISTYSEITQELIKLIEKFEKTYENIIEKFDIDNNLTYSFKIRTIIQNYQNGMNLNDITHKISMMNLNEKKCYICNKISEMPICKDGLVEVMKSLLAEDMKIKKNLAEFVKELELAIHISTHKKVTPPIVHLLKEFENLYKDAIKKIDQEHMQTYSYKIKKAIENSISMVETITHIENQSYVMKKKSI